VGGAARLLSVTNDPRPVRDLPLWRGKENVIMFHLIEFNTGFTVDIEVSPKHRLEWLRIQKGMRAYVGLRPHVVETARGPVEVADLYFEDGTVTRRVRFKQFRFVE
jgi:hypothetical protein